jgi:hypothetical protein
MPTNVEGFSFKHHLLLEVIQQVSNTGRRH